MKQDNKRTYLNTKQWNYLTKVKKMGPYTGCYGISLDSCRPTEWCFKHCYVRKNNKYELLNVKTALERRTLELLNPYFAENLIIEVNKRPSIKYIRFFLSGDIPEKPKSVFPEKFFNDFHYIADNLPNIPIRFTTRKTHIFPDEIRELHFGHANISISQSLDPQLPEPYFKDMPWTAPEDLPYVLEHMKDKNVHFCINDCPTCGYKCWPDPKSSAKKVFGNYWKIL